MTHCLKQETNIEYTASQAPCVVVLTKENPKSVSPAAWSRIDSNRALAESVAIRIVRRPVLTIWNAVRVAIPTPPPSALHVPTPITFDPCWLAVVVAAAFTHPRSRYPMMLAISQFPVPVSPNVTIARRRNDFVAGRWRCDSHDYRGSGRCGDASECCRQRCSKNEFPDHGQLPTIRVQMFPCRSIPLRGLYAIAHSIGFAAFRYTRRPLSKGNETLTCSAGLSPGKRRAWLPRSLCFTFSS